MGVARTAGLSILACALAAGGALAQPQGPAPTPPTMNQIARRHHELGSEYFRVGRYEDAAREFQQAYDLSPQALLLYNVGRAHEQAGNVPAALAAYERFAADGAPGADAADIQRRITALRARAPAPRGPAPTPTPAPTPAPALPPRAARYEYRRGPAARYGPPVMLGVGLACGALSVAFGVMAAGDIARVDRANQGREPWTPALDDAYDGARTTSTLAWALGAAGGAMVVGGALWFALRGPGERREVLQVGAAPTPGGALVTLGGAL